MLVGVLVLAGVLGLVVALVVLLSRGRDALDLSLHGLVRVYLFLASLAGVIVFTIGVAGIASYLLAATFGRDLVYGGPVLEPPLIDRPCPSGASCPPVAAPLRFDERERRQQEDLVRGITYTAFGVLVWGAHWIARRRIVGGEERASGLYRAYLILGTAVFGVGTIALLPTGIYQALMQSLVTFPPNSFRAGAGEALSGGLATLPVWLLYLWLVMRDLRTTARGTNA